MKEYLLATCIWNLLLLWAAIGSPRCRDIDLTLCLTAGLLVALGGWGIAVSVIWYTK
jgi:hypothetical protein